MDNQISASLSEESRGGVHLTEEAQQILDDIEIERTDKPLDPADEWVTGSVEEFLKLAAESGARVDELS